MTENKSYRQDFNPQEELPPISPEIKFWFPIPEPGQVNYEARIRPERIRIPEQVIGSLKDYVRETLQEISGYSKPKLDGVVFGLSGGVDSTATVALCKEALSGTRYFVKGIIMGRAPEGQQGGMNAIEYQDIMFAIQSSRDMGIDYEYVDISSLIDAVYQVFPKSQPWELSGVLPRLRSALLYQAADSSNAICAGTTNGTEFILAAFSVGGPAGHFQPFIDFYKSEVYKIAERLGVPDYIRERRPAISELGIYDEQLYGASCYVLDPILRRMNWQKKSPEKVTRELGHDVEWLRRIKELRIDGERGRKYPPAFVVGRVYKIKIKPDVKFDRDRYFNNLSG
ncbi:MAG: NAD(+) synthase [Nanoarchaeota archaeon]